jgi:hypothetical protein
VSVRREPLTVRCLAARVRAIAFVRPAADPHRTLANSLARPESAPFEVPLLPTKIANDPAVLSGGLKGFPVDPCLIEAKRQARNGTVDACESPKVDLAVCHWLETFLSRSTA